MRQSLLYASLIALIFIISGYATANVDEGLVLYLTFDNVKGKRILDESGNGLDAEVVKNTKFVKGRYGNAVRITNETEDCVNILSADALEISEEITMMAWVYHHDWTRSSSQWFDKGTYSKDFNKAYGMAVFNKEDAHSSEIGVILGGELQRRFIVQNNMRNKTWHHIVATGNDTSVKIYLDGEIVNPPGLLPPAFRLNFNGINGEDLRIGCAKGKPEYAFENGTIDEVAIWNRALSETEIRTAMRGNLLAVSLKDKIATTWGNIKQKAFQP